MDGELGAGGGAGGTLCGNDDAPDDTCPAGEPTGPMGARRADGRDAWSRYAFGGYVGFGLGARVWRSLGVFGRTRLQLTRARGVPTTLWASALGGVEGTLGPFELYVGAGWAAYFNAYDQSNTFILEAGISVPFAVR